MLAAPIPQNEAERLAEVRALQILDTSQEERFDRITQLCTQIFKLPMAYVSIVDANRQWFKSKQGVSACETARDISFCGHAILQNDMLVVPDAKKDSRFADNPLVTGEPFIQFYAGQSLKGPNGFNVGTLCIGDKKPREFSESEKQVLFQLAQLIENELHLVDMIKLQRDFILTKEQLLESRKKLSQEVEEAKQYVKSLLPAPLEKPLRVDWRFIPSSELGGDAFGYDWLDASRFIFYLLDVTGHGVGAALLATSVLSVLRSRASFNINFANPKEVITALNKMFPMLDHNNRYFSMWYGVYDLQKRTLEYTCAGHPPALLITCEKSGAKKLRQLNRGGAVVGAFEPFDYESEIVPIESATDLLVFSDGAYEIQIQKGDMWRYQDFSNFLATCQSEKALDIEKLMSHLKSLKTSPEFEDDVSILHLDFRK